MLLPWEQNEDNPDASLEQKDDEGDLTTDTEDAASETQDGDGDELKDSEKSEAKVGHSGRVGGWVSQWVGE